jgi:hypothetical protein
MYPRADMYLDMQIREAEKHIEAYKQRQELQQTTEDAFQFPEIGQYIMPPALRAQLERMADISRKEQETVFPPGWRF